MFLSIFVSIFFFVPLAWLLMDRRPPFTEYVGTTFPKTIKAGDWITVEWDVNVNRVCPGVVYREVIDAEGVICNYDPVPTLREAQISPSFTIGKRKLVRSFQVCQRAAPGPARYRAYTCSVCNIPQKWWQICGYTPEVRFNIAE